jgi:hypothetical protein
MRRTLGFVVLCATGCDEGGANDDTGGPAGGTCDTFVVSATPADGDTDAFFDTEVTFRLSAPDGTAAITVVEEASGALVPGTSATSGTVVTWTGEGPLESERNYVSTLTYACGDEVARWSTSSAGLPVTSPSSLEDNVYSIDLTEGRWVEPYGVGVILNPLLVGVEILVSPTSADATLEMRGALGDGEGNQDECQPTVEFPEAAFDNPSFSVEVERFELSIGDTSAGIDDFILTGSFSPDGEAIEGVTVGGAIDTRPLVPLVDGTSDDAFCQLIDTLLHVQCEPCADLTGPYCLAMLVDSLTAEKVSSQGLDSRTVAQIDADADCPDVAF